MTRPRDNPFRVDRVSALPFLGVDVPTLVDRFRRLGRAAIVGPHGVGKSTLLRSVGDALVQQGEAVRTIGLPGSATAAERGAALESLRSVVDEVILIDGFEQLTWRERRAALRPKRVLVTQHRTTRLPTLIELSPTTEAFDQVFRRLVPEASEAFRRHARERFRQYHGDIRETLFALYDDWAAMCESP